MFDGDSVRDLTRAAAARARRADRRLHDRRQRRDGAVSSSREGSAVAAPRRAHAGTLAAHRRARRGARDALPPAPDARALEHLLAQRGADPDRFADLSLSVVKLLGRGEYVVEQPDEPTPDHFGLAVTDYTHSTAPNRRFPDLVTQRLIKAALARRDAAVYRRRARGRLPRTARSRRTRPTRRAPGAEGGRGLLLQRRIGEVFDAVVTGASAKGTWVRVRHPIVEGKLDLRGESVQVGDRLRVKLTRVDPPKGFIDLRM